MKPNKQITNRTTRSTVRKTTKKTTFKTSTPKTTTETTQNTTVVLNSTTSSTTTDLITHVVTYTSVVSVQTQTNLTNLTNLTNTTEKARASFEISASSCTAAIISSTLAVALLLLFILISVISLRHRLKMANLCRRKVSVSGDVEAALPNFDCRVSDLEPKYSVVYSNVRTDSQLRIVHLSQSPRDVSNRNIYINTSILKLPSSYESTTSSNEVKTKPQEDQLESDGNQQKEQIYTKLRDFPVANINPYNVSFESVQETSKDCDTTDTYTSSLNIDDTCSNCENTGPQNDCTSEPIYFEVEKEME
ncbi:hypothetical protein BgiMline_026529 [Biomphalaria glabrata]|nr:hypothetical protein BgiMline_021005 [Biomphalaria glabrata]